MHIKVFDNFSLGKLGGKSKKDTPVSKETQAANIAEIGKKMNGKTKKLEKVAPELNGLAAAGDITKVLDTPPVRPHGPAKELSIEPEDPENAGITLDEIDSNDSIKLGEDIKVAEVTAEKVAPVKAAPAVAKVAPAAAASAAPAAAPAAPVEEKKGEKPDDADSLNNLFSNNEEEENPLANLINSLPDVTVRELMDDLAEIHRIIKEWRPSSKLV